MTTETVVKFTCVAVLVFLGGLSTQWLLHNRAVAKEQRKQEQKAEITRFVANFDVDQFEVLAEELAGFDVDQREPSEEEVKRVVDIVLSRFPEAPDLDRAEIWTAAVFGLIEQGNRAMAELNASQTFEDVARQLGEN